MKKNSVYIAILVVVLLPGCGGNLVDWGKQTFEQSGKQKDDVASIKTYVKQINMYDQLNTVGLFDALWLSDEVRRFYAEKYAQMTGKTDEEIMIMLRRLFKANSHNISFYVLTPSDVVLAVKPVEWAIYLEVDGKKYQPTFVKKCELPSQYQVLFGKRCNPHKQPYEVKFDRHDVNGNDILLHEVPHCMKLSLANPKYVGSTQWEVAITNEHEGALVATQDEQGAVTALAPDEAAPSSEIVQAVVTVPFTWK